jgi:hypothetical protein
MAICFGCMSPATSSLRMYAIRPEIKVIENAGPGRNSSSGSTGGNFSKNNASSALSAEAVEREFGLKALPYRYMFGISGICREWTGQETGGKEKGIVCKRYFPHVPSLLGAVLEDAETDPVKDRWIKLLSFPSQTETEIKIALWKRLVSASAAMLILSIFYSTALIAFVVLRPDYFESVSMLALIDVAMAITAAILWTVVANLQSALIRSGAERMGPSFQAPHLVSGLGIFLLWVLVLCKLMVTPALTLITFVIVSVIAFLAVLVPVGCCLAMCGGDEYYVKAKDQWGRTVRLKVSNW